MTVAHLLLLDPCIKVSTDACKTRLQYVFNNLLLTLLHLRDDLTLHYAVFTAGRAARIVSSICTHSLCRLT